VPKITYVGAGSAVFARQVITDVLEIEGLDTGEFALVDVDEQRLQLAHQLVEKLVARSGKDWKVTSSTDRLEVLDRSDFVVNSIEVAGLANVRHDYEIPLKYGVDQCIGDTIGPGGIFKALRTGPVWLDICRDIERICPRTVVLNYTNPMSILTLAALRGTSLDVVGLCHSVQGTSWQLSQYLGVP
jgi:alpha-galactosidase